jgi:hypothetical protein
MIRRPSPVISSAAGNSFVSSDLAKKIRLGLAELAAVREQLTPLMRLDTDEGVAWLSRGVPPRVRIRTFCFSGLAQGLEAACRAGGRMRYVPDHIVAAG